MQRKLIASLTLIFSCLLTLGQSNSDLVQLKDGSYVRGTIVEFKVNEMVKIQTVEGEVREYPIAEVKRTRAEGKYSRPKSKYTYESHTGFFNTSSVNLVLGGSNYNGPANIGFHTLNGFQYKGKWQIGVGTALDFYNQKAYVPLTGELRYHLRDQDVSPFIGAFGGYALTRKKDDSQGFWYEEYETEHKGGATCGFELGLRNMTKARVGYVLSAGYRFQQLKSSGYDGWWNGNERVYYEIQENQKLHRLTIRFGITFN